MAIPFKGHTIFAFFDTHRMYRRLAIPSEADILIYAGDACKGFNPADIDFLITHGSAYSYLDRDLVHHLFGRGPLPVWTRSNLRAWT